MSVEKKPKLVRSGESFYDIQLRLGGEFLETIEKFGLARDQDGNPNPKMAMSLLYVVANAVEINLHRQTHEYVTMRLNEQIERYITLGFHDVAGYTKESFRSALAPLVTKTLQFFTPPSERPIRNGEFAVLLVLPKRFVPQRRLLATLLGDALAADVDSPNMELRTHGQVAPDAPYVLVGVDGGRGQKDSSIEKADEWVKQHGRTYLSLSQLTQLLLVRPHFLSASSDFAQSEVLVLGEKRATEIIRLVATENGIAVEFESEKNVRGGEGVGKPYYAKLITA